MPKLTYLMLPNHQYLLVLHGLDQMSFTQDEKLDRWVQSFPGCVGLLVFSHQIQVGP